MLEGVIAGEIFSEVASAAFHGALDRLMKRRRGIAREEIEAQLRLGKRWAIQDDEAAAAMFAYLRAVQEGAARVNLRMIAEALFNAAQEPTFAPDEFRRHADALAGLSRDEVRLLAAFIRANRAPGGLPMGANDTSQVSFAWAAILSSDEVNDMDPIALAAALGRTGWVAPTSGFGSLGYYTTSAFNGVERLVDFERAKADLEAEH